MTVARTVKDFCAAYGVGVTTTYALIGAGKLRTVKVGRRTLIVEASAREWFESLSTNLSTTEIPIGDESQRTTVKGTAS